MPNEPLTLTDAEFIAQFENLSLDPSHFNHLGHIRLAYLYLDSLVFLEALVKVNQGIVAYATSLGHADKFHHTITDAIVRIIARRMDDKVSANWQEFVQQNGDLVADAYGVILQYYSQEALASTTAHDQVVAPDLQSI